MTPSTADDTPITPDVAIIGGGVAGLWLLNRLLDEGYQAVLLEGRALGGEQTLASQGMIHGGIKYTLKGALTRASQTLADMPGRWRDCLAGRGELDLRGVPVLSEHFYLFSGAGVSARMSTFLASRLTRGRVSPVPPNERPELLRHPDFKGRLYRLEDLVLDTPALIERLAHKARGHIFHTPPETLRLSQRDGSARIEIDTSGQTLTLQPRQLVLTAGGGNAGLLAQLGEQQPAMQTRPLHQVMVRHRSPYRFYGHCLGADTTPRLTLSSHPGPDDTQVWYLGGALAEEGVERGRDEQIQRAQSELAALFPWLELADAQWATLRVDRAEPRQADGSRPDGAFARPVPGLDNVIAAWPTKLTLVPELAGQILARLPTPGADAAGLSQLRERLATPPLAPTPWERAFGDNRHD